MMPSFLGASFTGLPAASLQYAHDTLLEDLSRQVSMSTGRRPSPGSNGVLSGNAMRISKPSSASSSPRNNLAQRRRTMMHDPVFAQRAQQMLEQQQSCLPTPGPDAFGNTYYEPVKRTTRPMSWHPSTNFLQTQQLASATMQQHTQYPFPNCCDSESYAQPAQFPPTPAAYSAYSSPVSTFSPLSVPYSAYQLPQQIYTSPVWNASGAHASVAATMGSGPFDTGSVYAPVSVPDYVEPSHSPVSWVNAPTICYDQNMTAPPTPEDLPKVQQAEPLVVKEECFAASEAQEEEEGDILIGLGLYDPPEKLPYHEEGGLLSASFEPKGKGLKLEDAWEPPASDDEDDEDGEGEVENEDE